MSNFFELCNEKHNSDWKRNFEVGPYHHKNTNVEVVKVTRLRETYLDQVKDDCQYHEYGIHDNEFCLNQELFTVAFERIKSQWLVKINFVFTLFWSREIRFKNHRMICKL